MNFITDDDDDNIWANRSDFSWNDDDFVAPLLLQSSSNIIASEIAMALSTTTVASLRMTETFSQILSRSRNACYDRSNSIKTIRSWDDNMFHRQTRLQREDFYNLVKNLEPILEANSNMGKRSSGSPITAELQLAITCRILAGAETLDMIWYSVSVNHVKEYVYETCIAIGRVLHNVSFPFKDQRKLQEMSLGWNRKQEKLLGCIPIFGIGMAGDGFLVKIREPSSGLDSSLYRNRKGYFALLCQAFCDSDCMFRIFEMRWPGGTNDVTAYQQTRLHEMMNNGELPDWFILLVDHIYNSCGGNHIAPFSREEMSIAETHDTDKLLHDKMRLFSRVISSLRVTIERAFGQLVRRFGMLWKAREESLDKVILMVITCVKLHNLCVERFLKSQHSQQMGHGLTVPSHVDVGSYVRTNATDEEIRNEFFCRYIPTMGVKDKSSSKRITLTEIVWENNRTIEHALKYVN